MKKDKEWLEKEINKTLNIDGGSGERIEGFNKGLEFSLDLIEELDEPELPVIPQWIADVIEDEDNSNRPYPKLDKIVFGMVNPPTEQNTQERFKKYVTEMNKDIDDVIEMVMYVIATKKYTIEKEKMYVVKINDQGSWLYLKSMQLYKDVESRTDLNSNFEAWKEKAIKFTNKEQAEGIAKFFNGEVVEVTE